MFEAILELLKAGACPLICVLEGWRTPAVSAPCTGLLVVRTCNDLWALAVVCLFCPHPTFLHSGYQILSGFSSWNSLLPLTKPSHSLGKSFSNCIS